MPKTFGIFSPAVAFFYSEVALFCHFRWHYLSFNASFLYENGSHSCPMPDGDTFQYQIFIGLLAAVGQCRPGRLPICLIF